MASGRRCGEPSSSQRARAIRGVLGEEGQIPGGDGVGGAGEHDTPALQQKGAIAKGCNRTGFVADEQHRVAGPVQVAVSRLATLLESRITDGENLVEDENVA